MQTSKFETGLIRFVVESATAESGRSLVLLKAIEDTVQKNDLLARVFSSMAVNLGEAVEAICQAPLSERTLIDSDGLIQTGIEETIDKVANALDVLKRKRGAALDDRQLKGDDGVVDSFDRVITALHEACDHLNELKIAIMENDADLSPLVPGGPYTDVEDFIASLRS